MTTVIAAMFFCKLHVSKGFLFASFDPMKHFLFLRQLSQDDTVLSKVLWVSWPLHSDYDPFLFNTAPFSYIHANGRLFIPILPLQELSVPFETRIVLCICFNRVPVNDVT